MCDCIAQYLLQSRLSDKRWEEWECDYRSLGVGLTLCPFNTIGVAAVGVVVASPLGFMCCYYLNKVSQVWVSSYEKGLKKNQKGMVTSTIVMTLISLVGISF